jgi:hypothetical protein
MVQNLMLNGTSQHNFVAAQYIDHVSIGHVLGCLVLRVHFCISGLMLSVMWHHYHWVFLHVSKDHSILLLGLLDPEDEGITILQNKKRHSPNDKVPHPRRFESSAQPILKLKFFILNCQKCFHFVYNKRQYISSWPCRSFIQKFWSSGLEKDTTAQVMQDFQQLKSRRCFVQMIHVLLCRDPCQTAHGPCVVVLTLCLPDWPWSMCCCVKMTPARLPMIHVLLCWYYVCQTGHDPCTAVSTWHLSDCP